MFTEQDGLNRLVLFNLINLERHKNSKVLYSYDLDLEREAQHFAIRMNVEGLKEHGLIKDHNNGKSGAKVEVIGWDQPHGQNMFGWWMQSEQHRIAIMGSFNKIGIGVLGNCYCARMK